MKALPTKPWAHFKESLSLDNKESEMTPKEALDYYCHTSQREFSRTVYTIEDIRAGELNGKKVAATLVNGKTIYTWL